MGTNQRTFKDVKYRKLEKPKDSDVYCTSQLDESSPQIPWRAVSFAFILCLGGLCLLILGSLLLSGHIDVKYADRTWPIMILGFLMFLPGVYHVWIAYYAFKGYPGYSFDDIPEFE